jgi:hypothetical protein
MSRTEGICCYFAQLSWAGARIGNSEVRDGVFERQHRDDISAQPRDRGAAKTHRRYKAGRLAGTNFQVRPPRSCRGLASRGSRRDVAHRQDAAGHLLCRLRAPDPQRRQADRRADLVGFRPKACAVLRAIREAIPDANNQSPQAVLVYVSDALRAAQAKHKQIDCP